MYLGSPLLPITISPQKAAQDLRDNLLKKNWKDLEVTNDLLILVPYFLYNYHYYVEQHKEGSSIVKEAVDGILAIEGHAIRIEEDKVDLIKYNWTKAQQTVPKGQFDEKWNNIDKKEQNEIIKLKTAEYFDVPKQNVIITSIRKVLVPFYSFKLTIDEKEYKITSNAVDGKFYGLKEVPTREKSAMEITNETINELKDPKTWSKYTKEIVFGTYNATKSAVSNKNSEKGAKEPLSTKKVSSSFDLSFFARPEILVLIMLLALLIIYVALFV